MSDTQQNSGTTLVTLNIILGSDGIAKIEFRTGGYTGLHYGRELLRQALDSLDQQDWPEGYTQTDFLSQGL